MNDLWLELLEALNITGPMAVLLVIFGLILLSFGSMILYMLVRMADMNRRLQTQADYFDVQIDWNSHTHRASLQALGKAAKAEGMTETILKMATKSRSR